jgi:hypothetical protein
MNSFSISLQTKRRSEVASKDRDVALLNNEPVDLFDIVVGVAIAATEHEDGKRLVAGSPRTA